MFRLDEKDKQLVSRLLTPSWLSGMLAISVALVICVGTIVTFELKNSSLQQQLLAWQSTKPAPALTQPGQSLPQNDRPTLSGSWPLLLFWSVAGLVIYAIAMSVIHNLARAEELRESLDYVNARPQKVLAETAEHLLLRLVAFGLLVWLLVIFVHQVLPYSITAAHASAADVFSLDGGLYALLSFGLILVSLHVQVILLRLSFGRDRIFSR